MAEPDDDNKLLDDDDWSNLLLKIELDLRSQFFFISYLQSIRSTISPNIGGEIAKIPSIIEFLDKCDKDKASSKPLNIPAQYTVDAYHYVLEDLTKLKLTKKRMAKYDYLREEMFKSTHELPQTMTFDSQLVNLGGFELYSLLVGDQSIRATWHGQLRLRPDAVEQTLDILLFRYKPNPPHALYKQQKHKCHKVAEFMSRDVPKYEASRLLRISIPVDHIGGVHFLPYPVDPAEVRVDHKASLESPAILAIDIMHPVNFYTRRINCTHPELNEWRERDDFTRNKLMSTYTRYLICGKLHHLFQAVGVLLRFRPYLRHKILKGVPDITTVSLQQFGTNNSPPAESNEGDGSNTDDDAIGPEVLDVLIKNKILDPNHTQVDYPLDGYDVCFTDFLSRIKDPDAVDQCLNSDLLELNPPCKIKEYMMDHRGLTGSHYSFCKGKVVGDDTYHCKKCKLCAGVDHWHSHKSHIHTAPTDKKFLYPIPLSGKLHSSHTDRPTLNESGSASGVDDMDEPLWPNPKAVPDAVGMDWVDLSN